MHSFSAPPLRLALCRLPSESSFSFLLSRHCSPSGNLLWLWFGFLGFTKTCRPLLESQRDFLTGFRDELLDVLPDFLYIVVRLDRPDLGARLDISRSHDASRQRYEG